MNSTTKTLPNLNENKSPMPLINEKIPKDVLFYKGTMFEVPVEIIQYYANLPEILEKRITRTLSNGMYFMYPNGGYGCHYCAHFDKNVMNVTMDTTGCRIINTEGDPGISVFGCTYEPNEEIRWVTTFRNSKSKITFRAQKTPCVVFDSLAIELIKSGCLDEYIIKGLEFNYPRLSETSSKPELEKVFKVNIPNERLFERAYGYLYKTLENLNKTLESYIP